ncbi:CarD family transcriptional regulator [Deinococcus roseus]|uniref:CarD family transcriptional regulator n=1 Tax=Deinococcus roseus TaxID=392414 RepID=UPI001664BDED|nr:CarD family transcriptional regulator [Deinococcus roseus]
MKKYLYNTGDRVVLPPYGVGVVSGISTKCVANATCSYYQVEFPNGTSKAYVPVESAANLRPALNEQDVPEILNRLTQGRYALPRQWSARHRKVTDILATGNPFEIATLAAELRRWNVERGLPDLDRQAFRKALKLIGQEISELATDGVETIRDIIQEELQNDAN